MVSGKSVIRFRKADEARTYEYSVGGDKLEEVDIPAEYTHNIENLGDTDTVTLMWANELFDPAKSVTYGLEIRRAGAYPAWSLTERIRKNISIGIILSSL